MPPTDDFFVQCEDDKRDVLAPLRAEVGWPEVYDADNDYTADLMWNYITALENAVTAERRLRRLGAI